MQTTTAAATLAAAQTVNAAAVRALRHAAVAVAVLVVGASLPTAVIVADLDAAAASTACVVMGALVVVGALVVGVSSLLDDLRATAAESHLRSARLADREHALKVAEAQARVAVEQAADLRAAHEAAVGGVCDGINEARALTAERDAARAEVATLTDDLDAAHDALAEAEARVRDHAATDAALAQVQADAERAEARAVEAEAEVARLRSDLSAVRVTMAEQVVAAQVERDAARAALKQ